MRALSSGRDRHVNVRGQARNERDPDPQVRDLVLLTLRAVVDIDAAVNELQVERPRISAAGSSFFGRAMNPSTRSWKLYVPLGFANHVHGRFDELGFIDHRCKSEDRAPSGVDVQLVESHESRCAGALLHDKTAHRHRRRKRVHAQRLDRHRAVERFRKRLLEPRLRDWGNDKETDQREGCDKAKNPKQNFAGVPPPCDSEDRIGGGGDWGLHRVKRSERWHRPIAKKVTAGTHDGERRVEEDSRSMDFLRKNHEDHVLHVLPPASR